MSSSKKHVSAAKEAAPSKKLPANAPFVFGKMNYLFVVATLVVMAIGFMLMSGSEGDIYDTRRTTIAPIVVILGFCLGFVAIFYKGKKEEPTEQ
jgi:FtsH-binding integral membrane protein